MWKGVEACFHGPKKDVKKLLVLCFDVGNPALNPKRQIAPALSRVEQVVMMCFNVAVFRVEVINAPWLASFR